MPKKILSAARRAFHVLSHRATSCVFLTASRGGVSAWFLVEAKLTRYCATLIVDGRKVATQAGPLLDRIGNLVSDAARPTMVRLSSHGFSGWAMVRPHAVTAHDLIAEESTVQEAKHDSILTDMLTAGTDRPGQVVPDQCAKTGKTHPPHRETHSRGRATTVAEPARG